MFLMFSDLSEKLPKLPQFHRRNSSRIPILAVPFTIRHRSRPLVSSSIIILHFLPWIYGVYQLNVVEVSSDDSIVAHSDDTNNDVMSPCKVCKVSVKFPCGVYKLFTSNGN